MVKINNTSTGKIYYNDLFRSDSAEQWEKAPGKNVLINALKEALNEGNIFSNSKVLDIGCGTGSFLYRIKKEVPKNKFECFGIDFSEEAIKKACKKYSDLNFSCQADIR